MNIVQALLGEHGAMYPMLARLEADLTSTFSPERTRVDVQMLQSTLVSHAELEEQILRPAIIGFLPAPTPGPTDHDVIREGLDRAVASADPAEMQRILSATLAFTRKHFRKEEQQLFQVALRELSVEQQDALGQQWAERRGVALS